MARVFISHASRDEQTARRLAASLEHAGHAPWLALDEILVGESIPAAIGQALAISDCVVVCWSSAASASAWVGHELTSALYRQLTERAGRVLPVRLEDAPLPQPIASLRAADLYPGERGWQRGTRELLLSIDSASKPADVAVASSLSDDDLQQYREWALAQHRGLDLIGVEGGDFALSLDNVFVPLRIASRALAIDLERRSSPRAAHALEAAEGDVSLDDIFRDDGTEAVHAILFGNPGAGKTTALRKLMHDSLRHGPEGLGLSPSTLPVFARLRRLTNDDLDRPFADFVDRELTELSGHELPDGLGRRLWQRGHLLLLLDGLDEIANDAHRSAVCRYLEWNLAEPARRHVRAALSCRYAGYIKEVRLSSRFRPLDIRPLDAEQVRQLVRNWFHEAQRVLERLSPRETEERAEGLIAVLDGDDYAQQQLVVLVSSPLLLTLLCVVVLRGGEMPKQRGAFYEQCLRVLLSKWVRSKAAEPLLDVDTTLAVLRPLAWKLHSNNRRDDLQRTEALLHIRRRLAELGKKGDAVEVLAWLTRATGVLEEYAPHHFGFLHLGLQEYLAAVHIASRGQELLPQLAATATEPWWHEVLMLAVGLPGRDLFAPLLRLLLQSDVPVTAPEIIASCLREAAEVDAAPFIELLETSDEPRRQATVLRMLLDRDDPQLVETARALRASTDADVAELAAEIVRRADTRDASEGDGHDLYLAYHDADRERAVEITKALRRGGLDVWIDVERVPPHGSFQDELETILSRVRAAAMLVTAPDRSPWQCTGVGACLELLADDGRPLVLLDACERAPDVPEELPIAARVDVRRGLGRPGRDAIRAVLGGIAHELSITEMIMEQAFDDELTGIRFLWIPEGRFSMGMKGVAEPVHAVRISGFWLGETPVTNEQYAVFLSNKTGHCEPRYWRDKRFSEPRQPVIGVSHADATSFCDWLRDKTSRRVMLPSEAQWEWAARGDDGRRYPWGNEPPEASRACFGLDWDKGKPAVVGAYPLGRGRFGTLDQAGGVWEWCRDTGLKDTYEQRKVPDVVDPVETREGATRVLRGGCWDFPAVNLLASARRWSGAGRRGGGFGFRVLWSPRALDP